MESSKHVEIENKQDFLDLIGASDEDAAKDIIYGETDCGAWLTFEEDGVKIGSIVEGSTVDCLPRTLRYPFTEEDWKDNLTELEKEADVLWNAANGTENNYEDIE